MYSIELCTINFKLVLKQVNNIGWCHLFLLKDTEVIELGAENINIAIQKISSIFDDVDFKQHNVDYEKSKHLWVMSLSEKHTSIYSKKLISGIELVFYNCQGNKMATCYLSNKDCHNWKHRLKEIQKKL